MPVRLHSRPPAGNDNYKELWDLEQCRTTGLLTTDHGRPARDANLEPEGVGNCPSSLRTSLARLLPAGPPGPSALTQLETPAPSAHSSPPAPPPSGRSTMGIPVPCHRKARQIAEYPAGRNTFSRWGGRSFLASLRRLFSQNKPQKPPRTNAPAASEPTTCAKFKLPTPVCMG
jgi:hypothetical protein